MREWLEFMADGGYAKPSLWLSDGWATVEEEGWQAPGYWQQARRRVVRVHARRAAAGRSRRAGHACELLRGRCLRALGRQASADRSRVGGRGARRACSTMPSASSGNGRAAPISPYPGYRAAEGALGEYNGKFMVNQMVLRGCSLATPAGHARVTYRNFFYPPARWQFSGLRLAGLSLNVRSEPEMSHGRARTMPLFATSTPTRLRRSRAM